AVVRAPLRAGAGGGGLPPAARADPARPGGLGRELDAWGDAHGVGAVRELIGRALPRRRDRGSLRSR
ncbi:MAG: hypothetical protein AB1Z66_01445, partial [Candidatus Limnocylindrales bacterium]